MSYLEATTLYGPAKRTVTTTDGGLHETHNEIVISTDSRHLVDGWVLFYDGRKR
jgi:hypothetical protein